MKLLCVTNNALTLLDLMEAHALSRARVISLFPSALPTTPHSLSPSACACTIHVCAPPMLRDCIYVCVCVCVCVHARTRTHTQTHAHSTCVWIMRKVCVCVCENVSLCARRTFPGQQKKLNKTRTKHKTWQRIVRDIGRKTIGRQTKVRDKTDMAKNSS